MEYETKLEFSSFPSHLLLKLPTVFLLIFFFFNISPLQITMRMVPKMLSPLVRDWAPDAFVISFKLETDPQILLDKSRQALERYRHQVVVANVLESRRTSVIIVTRDSQTPLSLSDEEIAQGMEIEEKIVSYLQGQHTAFIERKG